MDKRKSGIFGRREFIGATVASTLLAVGGSSLRSARSATSRRPNVVFNSETVDTSRCHIGFRCVVNI